MAKCLTETVHVDEESNGRLARQGAEHTSALTIHSLVTDRDLSKLAPKLGREWRSFLRSELGIEHNEIEHVESDGNLPVAEKIFRLLKLWKSKNKVESTIHCLVNHLKNFEYGLETWIFLTETKTIDHKRHAVTEGVFHFGLENHDVQIEEVLLRQEWSTEVTSIRTNPPVPTREPQYDTANSLGGSTGLVPRFWFVAEVHETLNVQGFEETLTIEEGTKIDIVDKMAASISYLGRDKDGHLFHIPKKSCSRLSIHSPVLWENSWFHEDLVRGLLEERFKHQEVGTFAIRNASEAGNFAISVKSHDNVLHFKIKCTHTGYLIANDTFYSLTDLIGSFSGIPMYSTNGGKIFLRKPLPK